jgi:hypothetical protein
MRRFLFFALALLFVARSVDAQTAKPTSPAKPALAAAPKPPAPPAPLGPNVRLELTVTDTYSGTPTQKTVSMLTRSGALGRIRTTNTVVVEQGPNSTTTEPILLNVDATATTFPKEQIEVRLTLEYRPAPQDAQPQRRNGPAVLNESLTIVLTNGKPLVVSQSADPATDRKVSVELKASILE